MKEPNFQEILKSKWQYYGMTDAANDFAVQEYARQYHEYLSSFEKTTQLMKKTLGYIPLDTNESIDPKEHRIIDGQWLKIAEVWIPGVNEAVTDLHRSTHFRPIAGGQRCGNCAAPKDRHKGPNLMCPAKDEQPLPGMKYD